MPLSLDELKKLQQRKYREQYGCFLAEGEHLVLELEKALLGNDALAGCELLVTSKWEGRPSPLPTRVLTDRQMAQVSDTRTPQGIVAVVPMEALQHMGDARYPRAIYLHEIQDPGNLGTVLRTLAWFGGFRCLLSPDSVDPFNPKVVRASMGAIFHVPVEQDVGLPELGTRFGRLAKLDMRGEPVSAAGFQDHDCYLFGNEARGVPAAAQEISAYTIAGNGRIDSLNVASAVAICAYALSSAPRG